VLRDVVLAKGLVGLQSGLVLAGCEGIRGRCDLRRVNWRHRFRGRRRGGIATRAARREFGQGQVV
jgi:hypothetical protein